MPRVMFYYNFSLVYHRLSTALAGRPTRLSISAPPSPRVLPSGPAAGRTCKHLVMVVMPVKLKPRTHRQDIKCDNSFPQVECVPQVSGCFDNVVALTFKLLLPKIFNVFSLFQLCRKNRIQLAAFDVFLSVVQTGLERR